MSTSSTFLRGLVSGIGRLGSYRLMAQAVLFVGMVVNARILTPVDYGVVAAVGTLSAFLQTFIDPGLTAAVIRNRERVGLHRGLEIMALSVGLALGLLLVLVAPFVPLLFHRSDLVLPTMALGGVVALSALPVIPTALLTKRLDFVGVGWSHLIHALVVTSLTALLGLAGWRHWALIVPLLVAPVLVGAYTHRRAGLSLAGVRKKDLLLAIGRAGSLFGSVTIFAFFNYWARAADKLVAARWYGTEAVGLYSRAYSALMLPLQLTTGVFSSVQMPLLQKLLDARRSFLREYSFGLHLLSLVVLPVSVLVTTSPSGVARVVWGSQWDGAAVFLPLLASLLLLQVKTATVGPVLLLLKKERLVATLGSFNAIVLIAGILIGALDSLLGMVIGYAVAYTFVATPALLAFGYFRAMRYPLWTLALDWAGDLVWVALVIARPTSALVLPLGVALALYHAVCVWHGARALRDDELDLAHRGLIDEALEPELEA